MCGLAGILTWEGGPPDRATLLRMGERLRHRGPDASGLLEDAAGSPAVGFVHRRLSIIDLSRAADQPLASEDGSVQAMLNGEIYNFRELRQALAGRHRFRSAGDTEALVHLYEERGDEAVAALDGMFALALWDAGRRRLLLARDAFGKKPLYYASDGRRLVFASEIKALLAAGIPAEMDEAALPEYLALGYVPTPRTLFRGIRRLPPASLLAADASGLGAPRAYWDLRFPPQGAAERIAPRQAAERVRELLTSAVRKRLVSDVPLGVLLSGGVDSAAVAALASRAGPPLRTFTVGFEGDSFYDERAQAAALARHLGSDHHDALVRADAASLIETLLEHHDEPFGDSSALPTYLVAREARRQVTVVLNGDGGDETFAGYDRFWATLLAGTAPAPLWRALRSAARLLPEGATYHGRRRRLRRFVDKAALPAAERLFAWAAMMDGPELGRLLADPAGAEGVRASYLEAFDRCRHASPLSRLLYVNARTYLLDDLLPKMDRMTMAHGLEARSPLLDRPLAEYAATLPDTLKRRGRRGKLVLKQAVRDLLPEDVLRRPKHGFGVPLGEWFRGPLRPLLQDVLGRGARLRARLRPEALDGLVEAHLAGRADRGHVLWTLLTLELWLRKHRLE
jgi:asparagine synthase (glutamine-hydrolysing)